MKRSCIFIILFTFLLALSACSAVAARPEPPQIHYGEDMCSECGMIINEARYAASYVVQQGEGAYETYIFDDIGDMVHHMAENPSLAGVGWWVHDVNSEEWIDAATAYYVVSDEIETPMGHGTVALATQEAADALAAEVNGRVLDWDTVRSELVTAGHGHN